MNRDIETLIDLIAIPGEATKEEGICARLKETLLGMGVPEDAIVNDETYKQSEYGGQTGNLIVRLDGHGRGERRMFSTHMDTVPGAVGSKPRVDGDLVVNDAPDKALGADARAGCACLMAAVRALMEKKGDHPPRTFVFFVQEEVGLVGSRGLDTSLLGDPMPAMCFNFDGSMANEVAYAVVGTERTEVNITGIATHASRPQKGISAAVIMAEALAELNKEGWNAVIEKPDGKGTANLGILKGGTGSNVTMPELYALTEARSFDKAFKQKIVARWKQAFVDSVERTNAAATEADGKATVEFIPGPAYDPYVLPRDAPVVRAASAAITAADMEPFLFKHWGGMDTCHIVAKGIPAVGMGMGEAKPHSVDEYAIVSEYLKGCRVAVSLALEN